MKVLHTGRGTAGSWQCRGVQMGHAIPRASQRDIAQADAVVLVKRPYPGFLEAVRGAGKLWVWDVVDAYPQPACTSWCRADAIRWFRAELKRLRPHGVIFPNRQMAIDCNTVVPSTVIYHHHRIGMAINPVREEVSTVGYEGSPVYLGGWLKHLLSACEARGWSLTVNQGVHADFDICVAFRDAPFNGYAQRHWKSNVKLANCHGSGTPFIGPAECGYTETATGLEEWVDQPAALSAALDRLADYGVRQRISGAFQNKAITVEKCREQLQQFLASL
ncbi:MAG: hypothetical protein KDH99_01520 [Alcanivoracaceae bacterium]|nr:hypothetical protein [Alcanivoracaceae bacterium]